MRILKANARHQWMVLSFWVLGAILVAVLFKVDAAHLGERAIMKITGADPVAYYANAHSLLFDFDFNLANQFGVLKPLPEWFRVVPNTGLPGSPFALGFSLVEIPFLFAGNIIASMSTGQADGYSQICIDSYFVGIICFLIIGLIFLFKLLRKIGIEAGAGLSTSDWVAYGVTLGLLPASNVGYYAFSPMSHIVAFMAVSMFFFVWWGVKDTDSLKGWLLCGLSGGFVFLCRWQAVLYLLIPIAYELHRLSSQEGDRGANLRKPWLASRATCVLTFILTILIQFVQWKIIYGNFFLVPQGDAFMEFPPRHFFHVMFSSEHGWFVWTPIVLIGVVGLVLASSKKPIVYGGLLLGVFLQVGVAGALPKHWHGYDSFGARILVCSMPVIAIGLAFLLFHVSRRMRLVFLGIGLLCSVYTMLFALQYRLDMVPHTDRLTWQELIGDKLTFNRALQRRNAFLSAQTELNSSQPQNAIRIAEAAQLNYGSDRRLLECLLKAYEVNGDSSKQMQAREQLQQLMERRIF